MILSLQGGKVVRTKISWRQDIYVGICSRCDKNVFNLTGSSISITGSAGHLGRSGISVYVESRRMTNSTGNRSLESRRPL